MEAGGRERERREGVKVYGGVAGMEKKNRKMTCSIPVSCVLLVFWLSLFLLLGDVEEINTSLTVGVWE